MRRFLPILLVFAGLAACSSSSSSSASCSTVKNSVILDAIHADSAQAVRAGEDGFFVARSDGATWFTTADPKKDDSGLVLPLDDAARAASDAGVDVPAGSPVYKGHTDDEPGARVVRSCV